MTSDMYFGCGSHVTLSCQVSIISQTLCRADWLQALLHQQYYAGESSISVSKKYLDYPTKMLKITRIL